MTLLIIVVLAILALGLILAYLPTFDYKYKKEIFVVCGAFIMGINFIKILPFGILKIGEQAGLYLLLGFFIQLLFEKMSEGVEMVYFYEGLLERLFLFFRDEKETGELFVVCTFVDYTH